MSNRSETFGRLLKGAINSIATYEGKTAPIIEEELAEKVGLAGSAIQRYKAGYLPPEPRTIEIIAEAAVRRGFLSREWLQRFLHAARYHQADKLLDQLCPIGPARPRPPRVYQNLPAPTYSQFVMRQEAFAEVLDGLGKRSAAVIIVGLGGNGKTSLAREIADSCLKGEDGQALFDAAVWVSDQDRPGTTNLSVVLDEIARTLDYPGFTQFEHDEKRHEVEQLLRRQRVLICIDNFETITDGALLSWLLNLPEPSKALITTREYRREYRRGGWPVELRGMSDSEARALIDERLKVLRIEKLVSDLAQIEPLVAATGGNPKAIEMTLGLVKYERRPLVQVVDDLYAARGELFDDLFSRAWALLDEAARRVLMVMVFFPASASSETLSATADVQGFAFERAVERLADLALLDVQYEDLNSPPRFVVHSLVRAFAARRLNEQKAFEATARDRWVRWYAQLVSRVGWCRDDMGKLALLDSEYETILIVIDWAFQQQLFTCTQSLSRDASYYYYVRGLWNKRATLELIRIEASRKLADIAGEAFALSTYVHMLSMQGNTNEASKHVCRLKELAQNGRLDEGSKSDIWHAIAFYNMARRDFSQAEQAWSLSLSHADQVSVQKLTTKRHWLAICLYRSGKPEQARQLFSNVLAEALQQQYQRSIAFCRVQLATIDLDYGKLDRVAEALQSSRLYAEQYQDRPCLAEIERTASRFYLLQEDVSAASHALSRAIDLLERLGMRRELAEAREELRRLDEMGEAPAA